MINRNYFLGSELRESRLVKIRASSATICSDKIYKRIFFPSCRITQFGTLTTLTQKGLIKKKSFQTGLTPEELKLLPIPTGRYSRFLGCLPLKQGSIPLKVTRTSKTVFNWYHSPFCPDQIKQLPDPTSYHMISGSWQSNYSHLFLMASDTDKGHTWPSLWKVLKYVHLLKLPHLPSPNISDLDNVRISPHTFPGLVTSEVLKGFNRGRIPSKKVALPASTLVARKIWTRIISEGYLDDSLYSCGGREKLSCLGSELNDYKEGRSRLVLMPELASQIVNMCWQQPFQDEYILNKGPIWIGRGMSHNAWVGHYDRFKNCKTLLEGDWKDFDSTVSEELMILAFQVIRMSFPANRTVDRFFDYFVSAFVHKNIATPGGFVYRISKGIPSGSCWTSLIGSIVNWIVWVDTIRNYPAFKRRQINVEDVTFTLCGDDFLLGFNTECNLDIKLLRRWILKRHGMKLKEGAGIKKLVSSNEAEVASFLKTTFNSNGPSIKISDLYEQIVLPKTSLDKNFDYIKYIVDRLRAPPGCNAASESLASLFAYHEAFSNHVSKFCLDAQEQLTRFQSGFSYSKDFETAYKSFVVLSWSKEAIKERVLRWQKWVDLNWTKIYLSKDHATPSTDSQKISFTQLTRDTPTSSLRDLRDEASVLYLGAYAY